MFLQVFAGATAATPSRTLHNWMKLKKTSVGTTSSSLAKVVLPKVSAAAHRSRHPKPVSCSSCCAVWCLRLPADFQAASPVPQARPSSQCWSADGACSSVTTPPILMDAGGQWSRYARWPLCGCYGVRRTLRCLQLLLRCVPLLCAHPIASATTAARISIECVIKPL